MKKDVGVCFYFEDYDIDVWSGRRIDLDAWNYAIKAAGDINTAIVVNKTDQKLTTFDGEMNFSVVSEFPELPGKVAYVCCPWDEFDHGVALWDFDHDVDWYAFGPASGWQRRLDFGVYIPISGRGALHSTHIASVVCMHRYGVLSWR